MFWSKRLQVLGSLFGPDSVTAVISASLGLVPQKQLIQRSDSAPVSLNDSGSSAKGLIFSQREVRTLPWSLISFPCNVLRSAGRRHVYQSLK